MKLLIVLLSVISLSVVTQVYGITGNDQSLDIKKSSDGLAQIIQLLAAAVTITGIGTAIKGLLEYSNENKRKRAQQFIEMRHRFKENQTIMKICDLLENDDVKLKDISSRDKIYFLGFYEEVALLMNSKLIKKEIVHYMFGYYAIKCEDSINFWATGVDKTHEYWTTFRRFVEDMKDMTTKFDSKKF